MVAIVIEPVSRSLTPGSRATFAVRVADGPASIGPVSSLVVRPDPLARNYEAHFAGGGPEAPGGGGRQILTVEVPRGAGLA